MKLLTLLLSIILIFSSCSSSKNEVAPEENILTYSRTLQIWQKDGCTIARIVNPQDTTSYLATYIFTDNDTCTLPDIPDAVVISRKNLDKLMVFSSVHASALKELGAFDAINIVGDAQYFNMPEIKEKIKTDENYKKVVQAAFSSRRKTLENNLVNSFKLNRIEAQNILQQCGIDLKARGETLDYRQFANISQKLKDNHYM